MKKHLEYRQCLRLSGESGVSIVILVLFLFVFAAGVALAIDLAIYMSALTRAQTVADQVSLAALERQLVPTGDAGNDDPADRLALAEEEAVYFSELNAVFGEVAAKGENYIDLYSGTVDPGRSRIIPGRYVYNDIDLANSIQAGASDCDDSIEFPRFCGFSTFRNSTHDELAINSMRVIGELHSPLLDRFSGLIGYESFPIRVQATAFREPVELLFVLDRSGSMAEESFLRLDDTSVPAIRAALPTLLLGQACDAGSPPQRPSTFPCTFEDYPGSRNPHEVLWRKLRASGLNRPKEHFRDDYSTDSVGAMDDTGWQNNLMQIHPNPANYTSSGYSGSLMYRELTGNYEGPMPFVTILKGLYSLLEQMREGNMAGNRLGFVFFGGRDELVNRPDPDAPFSNPFGWTHVIHSLPSNELCYVENLLCSGDPNCGGANPKCPNGQTIVQRGMDSTILEKLNRLGFFPTFALNTDAYFGLVQAFIELERTRSLGVKTNRHIVMISGDGLSNCIHNDPNRLNCIGWQRMDFNYDGKIDNLDLQACIACEPSMFTDPGCEFFVGMDDLKLRPGGCNNAYPPWIGCPRIQNGEEALNFGTADCANRLTRHEESMGEIRNYARFLAGREVTLNAVLSSESIGVNILDIGGPGDTCLTQEQAHRQHDWYTSNFTEGCEGRGTNWANNEECQEAYHQRSPARPFRRVLREWEWATAITGGKLFQILPSPNTCTPRTSCTQGTVTRRDTDPECRPVDQQWSDIMSELTRSSRYSLAPRH